MKPVVDVILNLVGLENLIVKVGGNVAQLVRETAEEVSTESKLDCPVDTGNLRSSIHVTQQNRYEAIVATGTQAPYAELVHNGTSKMAARPFMTRAAKRVQVRVNRRARDLTK